MIGYEALLEAIRCRRSIRRFRPEPVGREAIEHLVEAARWAPSNHNRQGWKFVVLDDRDEVRALADRVRDAVRRRLTDAPRLASLHADQVVHHATLFGDAPCVILVLHKRPASIVGASTAGVLHAELVSGECLSAAMAVENMLLVAPTLGLGACVMTAPLAAREVFGDIPDLPSGFEPTCLVAVGYPDEDPPAPRRKPIRHLVEYRTESR